MIYEKYNVLMHINKKNCGTVLNLNEKINKNIFIILLLQDESGAAAILTVHLVDEIGGKAPIRREVKKYII
jgi:hypothetical protein